MRLAHEDPKAYTKDTHQKLIELKDDMMDAADEIRQGAVVSITQPPPPMWAKKIALGYCKIGQKS